jgi:hypothetical protein
MTPEEKYVTMRPHPKTLGEIYNMIIPTPVNAATKRYVPIARKPDSNRGMTRLPAPAFLEVVAAALAEPVVVPAAEGTTVTVPVPAAPAAALTAEQLAAAAAALLRLAFPLKSQEVEDLPWSI